MTDDESGTVETETETEMDALTEIVRSTWTGYDSPSTAVAEAIAIATGRNSVTMDPLYGAINTDALDALMTAATNGGSHDGLSVSFQYDGVDVAVHGDGGIEVRPGGTSIEN